MASDKNKQFIYDAHARLTKLGYNVRTLHLYSVFASLDVLPEREQPSTYQALQDDEVRNVRNQQYSVTYPSPKPRT